MRIRCKKPFTHQLQIVLLVMVAIFSGAAHAATPLFSVIGESSEDGQTRQLVLFNSTNANDMKDGLEFDVPFPKEAVRTGTVDGNTRDKPSRHDLFTIESDDSKIIQLNDGSGVVELHLTNNSVAGITLFDTKNSRIYRTAIDGNGRGVLAEQDIDDFLCIEMPIDDSSDIADIADSVLASTPPLNELQTLQSNPGAAHTLFINYWGGTLTGSAWNTNFNSGNPIIYSPYSRDSDTSTFSTQDQYLMWMGWLEAKEDFEPFDVNVTTDIAVYNATAVADRGQIIATTTNYFYQGAGGAAYVTGFGSATFGVGFAWNSSLGSLGMTISHEFGHQLRLGHDGGLANANYYSGHGVWGPVMGAPFSQPYVQWSRGDYAGATNQQDDMAILISELDLLADDATDSYTGSSVTALPVPTTGFPGVITPNGAGTDPADWYTFTLASAGELDLILAPDIGFEGESFGGNLALDATLVLPDSSMVSIASTDNTPLNIATNQLTYNNASAPAGTYYIGVEANSPDTNWATGFDEYGNGGGYTITVDVEVSMSGPSITAPDNGTEFADATPDFSWDSNGQTVSYYWLYLGSVAGAADHFNSGVLPGTQLAVQATAPTNGSEVYATLHYYTGGAWASTTAEYTATTETTSFALLTPTPGQHLADTTLDVTWVRETGTTYHWVGVGSDPGVNNYYTSGALSGAVNMHTITGLPQDGRTMWVTVYRYVNSAWANVSLRVAADQLGPYMVTPAFYITDVPDTGQTFEWTPNDTNPSYYWVYVGSTAGGNDLGNSSVLPSSTLNFTTGALAASTAYVRLFWYEAANGWSSKDFEYTTTGAATGPSAIRRADPVLTVFGTESPE